MRPSINFFPCRKSDIEIFHLNICNKFWEITNNNDYFKRPLSMSLNFSERDLELLFFKIFKEDKDIEIKIDYKILNKRIDFLLKKEKKKHFIEFKDCGFFESHYWKAVSVCDEIEYAKNLHKVITSLKKNPDKFKTYENRQKSKVECLDYYSKSNNSENIAKDIYKIYELYEKGEIIKGDICSFFNFVYWPNIYSEKDFHNRKMERTNKTLKLGTELLIEHLKNKKPEMKKSNLTYTIKTFKLPPIVVFHPSKQKKIKCKNLKLTIEFLSWVY